MKQIILLLVIFSSYNGYAQKNADAIIGKWLRIPKEDLIIEVYELNDEYKGKINWAKNNDKRKPVDFVLLDKLKYNQKRKKCNNSKINQQFHFLVCE